MAITEPSQSRNILEGVETKINYPERVMKSVSWNSSPVEAPNPFLTKGEEIVHPYWKQ